MKLFCCFLLILLAVLPAALVGQPPSKELRPDLPQYITSDFEEEKHLQIVDGQPDSLVAQLKWLNSATLLLRKSKNLETRTLANQKVEEGLNRLVKHAQFNTEISRKIEGIAQVESEDKTWTIYSWQLFVNDSTYQYSGLMVINQDSSKIFKLEDQAQNLNLELEYELLPHQWYGALYYGVKHFTTRSGRDAWLLFGFDADGYLHRRKLVDVLVFDRQGQPRFGAEVFRGKEGQPDYSFSRLILEYRVDAKVGLRYNEALGGIAHDRLVTGPPVLKGGAPSQIPDGSYDGYVYNAEKGLWEWRMEWFDRVISSEPPGGRPKSNEQPVKRDLFGRPK